MTTGRMTTAMARGRGGGATTTGRGGGATASGRGGGATASAATRGRGGGRGRSKKSTNEAGTSHSGRGKKRAPEASSSHPPGPPARITTRNRHNTYNIGPGSAHHILFGDGNQQVVLPDLNEAAAEEMQTTQTAPTADSCFLP
jgi:hypothetical protein